MCSFVFIFSLLLTELQIVLTVKDMLPSFVFYEFLGAAEKNKNNRSLPQHLSRMTEQRAFWQEIATGPGLGLLRNALR